MNKVLVVVMLLLTLSLLVTGCATTDVNVEEDVEETEEEEELEELEGDMEFEELDEDLGDVI